MQVLECKYEDASIVSLVIFFFSCFSLVIVLCFWFSTSTSDVASAAVKGKPVCWIIFSLPATAHPGIHSRSLQGRGCVPHLQTSAADGFSKPHLVCLFFPERQKHRLFLLPRRHNDQWDKDYGSFAVCYIKKSRRGKDPSPFSVPCVASCG